MDESRFGLQTVRRRRLTLRAVKPIGSYQHDVKNFWLYGAVAPRCGAGYFESALGLTADHFQNFLQRFDALYVRVLHGSIRLSQQAYLGRN